MKRNDSSFVIRVSSFSMQVEDLDRFDLVCDHLMAHDTASGMLVGTYRMQSGYRAKGNLGYYGEEFLTSAPSKACVTKFWSLEGLAF